MLSLLRVLKYHYEQEQKQSAVMHPASPSQTTGSWHRSSSKTRPVFQGSPRFASAASWKTQWSHASPIFAICVCARVPFVNLTSLSTQLRRNPRGTNVLHLYVAFINEWVDIRRPGRSKGSCLSNLGERAQVHRRDACSHLSDTSARCNFLHKDFSFLCAARCVKIN